MDGDWFAIGWRTLFLYFFILAIMRLMGKREIGKLSVFDFVVSLMIAEIAVFAIEKPDMPFLKGLFPIMALVITQVVLSYISLKSKRFRDLIEGKPAVLISNGKINDREMAKQRYNVDDLLVQLREKNIRSIADVEFAILEPTGKLSVFEKPEKQPVSREELGIRKPDGGFPLPVIVDGQVMEENLAKIGKNRFWLKQKLRKIGTTDFRKIMFASVDERGNLFVDLKD